MVRGLKVEPRVSWWDAVAPKPTTVKSWNTTPRLLDCIPASSRLSIRSMEITFVLKCRAYRCTRSRRISAKDECSANEMAFRSAFSGSDSASILSRLIKLGGADLGAFCFIVAHRSGPYIYASAQTKNIHKGSSWVGQRDNSRCHLQKTG